MDQELTAPSLRTADSFSLQARCALHFAGGESERRSRPPTLESPAGGRDRPTFPLAGQNQVFRLSRYSQFQTTQKSQLWTSDKGEGEESAITYTTYIKDIVISQTSLNCQKASPVNSQTLRQL